VQTHSPERGAHPGSSAESELHILVIDDDPQAEALVELALADATFRASLTVAATAAEGLRAISSNAHDVYLVDYRLPDKTGLELITQAKAAGADKPFILMTGYGSGAVDDAALNAGAADYVEKHLLGTHLERAIRYAVRDWRSERALRQREEQLRQSHKMEAIGRLAGGVAHDFNNLLTAIVGYTDLALERLDPSDPTAEDISEIRNAADRAAALTRQLLAFSRKQFLQPVRLDLNTTVGELLQMLNRVIGSHVRTVTSFKASSAYITADPGQIEQIVFNLVLNARDAMPQGGTLTIATDNVQVTEANAANDGMPSTPGTYLLLSISDTGVGMDRATRERAFEPFFTTKSKGKGSGLGLSTVYGMVEHGGGAIALDSEPGKGTSVRTYFPLAAETAPEMPARPRTASTRGTETILLVEDNDAVRELARRTLAPRGYTVVEAASAEEALEVIGKGPEPDLLLTDIVMPGLSGPNLAARLLQERPALRVMYMSGYSGDDAAAHGPVWLGVPLVQKPFTPQQLAERVRTVLDGPARSES
jgi:two-component system, cell cycle sensor histidine kinase and response regulator CckA